MSQTTAAIHALRGEALTITATERTTLPLVSVIIPAYNAAAFLARAVASCTESPYHRLEIVIVNDGSSDATAPLADSLVAADQRIVTLHQENRGLPEARNSGLRRATGDYIVLLDADDELAPDWLPVAVTVLERHSRLDGVYGDWVTRSSRTGEEQRRSQTATLNLTTLLSDNALPVNALVLRNALYRKSGLFDATLPTHEDWHYWLRAAYTGWRLKRLPQEAGIVYTHGMNMSGDWRRMSTGRIACLDYVASHFRLTPRQRRTLRGRYAVERFFATLEDLCDGADLAMPPGVQLARLLAALRGLPITYHRSLNIVGVVLAALLVVNHLLALVHRPNTLRLAAFFGYVRRWSHLAPSAQRKLGYA